MERVSAQYEAFYSTLGIILYNTSHAETLGPTGPQGPHLLIYLRPSKPSVRVSARLVTYAASAYVLRHQPPHRCQKSGKSRLIPPVGTCTRGDLMISADR